MAQVLVEVTGALGRLRLNRPEALNSLTPEMVRLLVEGTQTLLDDPRVKVIAVSGEGARGFCAGGDIKVLGRMGREDPEAALEFWAEEYRLNLRISALGKPWLALMDGICMGGGVGLSVHGSHRVVTERTRFAMPETGIGYFPDVGASYALSRTRGEFGTYLGLTGLAISGADALAAGLADVFLPSERLEELLAELAAGTQIDAALGQLRAEAGPAPLQAQRELIARCFAHDEVLAIFEALERETSEFARETLARLRQQSPTALVVTLALLRRAAGLPDLRACLEQELAANRMILDEPDFYEGIRAAVVDKDRNPRWRAGRIEDLDQGAVLARLEAALARVPGL